MKIVFDTNVIISALITHGLSYRVLDICIDKHVLFISDWIINELNETLDKKFDINQPELDRIIDFLYRSFIKIKPQGNKPTICRDVDDNNILFLAESVNADIIITGDDDLLILEKYKNIKILTPREFIEEYEK